MNNFIKNNNNNNNNFIIYNDIILNKNNLIKKNNGKNNNNKNNNNNNYLYYKKIFNNKYLSRYIYFQVKQVNLISLYNRKKYIDSDRPLRSYEELDFKFIVENKYYSVLVDIFLKDNESSRLLISNQNEIKLYFKDLLIDFNKYLDSIYNKQVIDEFYKKFYKLNKQLLNTCQFNDIPIKSLDQNQSIQHSNQHHQQQIYQLQQREQCVQKILKVQNLDLLELSVFYSNFQFFRIIWDEYYSMITLDSNKKSKLIDWCLINGDVETLDFLYMDLGFKEFDQKTAFQYSSISDNRESTLNYLFNKMNFTHFCSVTGCFSIQNCIYQKILQINPILFKQLNDCISPPNSKSLEFLNLSLKLPFKNLLNLNLNINLNNQIFISTINYLLNLDISTINLNDQLYFNNIIINNINNININSNNITNNSNNKLIKNLKNLFKSSSSQQQLQQQQQQNNYNIIVSNSNNSFSLSFNKINLNNFNIKREIKRYYIYYNLINLSTLETILIHLKFIIKFINKYKEYQLIDHILYPDKYGYLKDTFLYNMYKSNNNNCNNNNNNNKKDSNNNNNNNSNIYFIKKVLPMFASYHTNLFKYLFLNKKNEFIWDHKNNAINIVSTQNFELIKFCYENGSNDITICKDILDNKDIDNIQLVEYLVKKGYQFTKSSFFNSIKNNNLELFKFYIENSNDTQKDQFIYHQLNCFYSLISDNLFFLKQLNYYLENQILIESKLKNSIIQDLKLKLILPNYLK